MHHHWSCDMREPMKFVVQMVLFFYSGRGKDSIHYSLNKMDTFTRLTDEPLSTRNVKQN